MNNRIQILNLLLEKYKIERDISFENICVHLTNPYQEESNISELVEEELKRYCQLRQMVNSIDEVIATLE